MALLAPFNPSGKKQDILQFAFASRLPFSGITATDSKKALNK
jgi:hypothetical protein